MKCDRCQTENKEGAKFCAKCGTALSVMPANPTPETKLCPTCGKALKPDAKFCGGCGHKFEQAEAVQTSNDHGKKATPDDETHHDRSLTPGSPLPEGEGDGSSLHEFLSKVEIAVPTPEIKSALPEIAAAPPVQIIAPAEVAAELTKPCPKCGKALKADAKFCGGCGHNFMQAVAAQPNRVEAPIPQPEFKSAQSEIKIASQSEKIAEQARPKNISEIVQEEKSGNKPDAVSAAKTGLPVAIIAGGAGLAVALIAGGGFFYYKSHTQAVAAKMEQKPLAVIPQPAPTPVAVPVVPPSSSIPVSSPAPVSATAPVVQPVVEPAAPPAPPVASAPKKPVVHAKQKGETQDDRKLLNAIDQYMDKQK